MGIPHRLFLALSVLLTAVSLSCNGSDFAGPSTGTLEISVATTGEELDPDGYSVKVDGEPGRAIGPTGGLEPVTLTAGSHTVLLDGVAGNCSVAGDNPRPIAVTPGVRATVSFEISCVATAAAWTAIPLPGEILPTGFWASSPSDIFVIGRPSELVSVLLHFDGQDWTEQVRGRRDEVIGVWGSSPTDVFAVGYDRILRYDGGTWVDAGRSGYESQVYYRLVWGAPGALFVGGYDDGELPERALMVQHDGAAWLSPFQLGFGFNGSILDISGTSASDVYAIGYESPWDVDPDAPEEHYVDYAVLHYHGSAWTPSLEIRASSALPGDDYALTGVWAGAPNDVFVVATGGRIFHYNGTSWEPMISPTSENLTDVWGISGSSVYAVGSGGILHYDGTSWSVINPSPAARVWGTATDVFVLSGNVVLHRRH